MLIGCASFKCAGRASGRNRLVVLAFPLSVGALEVFYGVFVEDPEAGGYFIDQVMVVGD